LLYLFIDPWDDELEYKLIRKLLIRIKDPHRGLCSLLGWDFKRVAGLFDVDLISCFVLSGKRGSDGAVATKGIAVRIIVDAEYIIGAVPVVVFSQSH
jgi:hypothetical protein